MTGWSAPPAEWFQPHNASRPLPLTVADDGRVHGTIAAWNTCHAGRTDRCVTPPRSRTNYAYFNLGEIRCADGSRVPAGKITMGTGHANLKHSARSTVAHYDNTGTTVAIVRAYEDDHGVQVVGCLAPDVSAEQVATLMSSPISGDWRTVDGNLELVAALAVNTPGFPVLRAGDDSMVASVFAPFDPSIEWLRATIARNPNIDALTAAMLVRRWRNGRAPQPRDSYGRWTRHHLTSGHVGITPVDLDVTPPARKPRRSRNDPQFAEYSDDDLADLIESTISEAITLTELDEYEGRNEQPDTLAAWQLVERADNEYRVRQDQVHRREAMRARREADREAKWATVSQLMDDENIDHYEAVERVFGTPTELQIRREALRWLHDNGYYGDFRRASKARYHDLLAEQYAQAEDDTRGAMLKSRYNPGEPGREEFDAKVGSIENLWDAAPAALKKYASEELLLWFDQHGRVTLQRVRDSLLAGDFGHAGRSHREDYLQ
ncbi:MAG: hypothetical protein LLG14_12655 [Nocardiaceae bacterium]|nr:hypothetical protein [Nocardiaceae bacterium]